MVIGSPVNGEDVAVAISGSVIGEGDGFPDEPGLDAAGVKVGKAVAINTVGEGEANTSDVGAQDGVSVAGGGSVGVSRRG